MASLIKLPIELKLELLGHLTSTTDLASISRTCRSFHDMTLEPYWKTLQNQVFQNETAHQSYIQLIGLSKIRNFKAKLTESTLLKPPTNDGRQGDLSELTNLRRTIRWFTNRFFRYNLDEDEPAPSEAEIFRVDKAFCVLWLWMEASYEPTKRNEVSELVWWATRPYSIDNSLWYFQEHGVISGTLLAVYWFLRSQLEHIGPLIAQRKDKCQRENLASLSYCVDQYLRFGIPNILLINKGLDGIKNLLQSPLESQLEKSLPYFDYLDYTKHDRYAYWGGEEIVDHFVAMIGELWCGRADYSELSSRPLWKSPGGVYHIHSAVWNQGIEFDYMSTFWDDQRLLNQGYCFPLDFSEFRCKKGNGLYRAAPHGYICNSCPPNRPCYFRPR
ncbi:hypothetical protein TWF506_001760 [Arthrobotrys conoides]|uniref:F-box domain-containing protein n=1 Tax=Arthrobotrys conoides TaxID=74498 RepID=A0AAN8PS88_9PEZI